MKTKQHRNRHHSNLPPGEGYLLAIGWLQIGAGALTVIGSLLAIVQSLTTGTFPWFHGNIGQVNGVPADLIANYLSFQALFGWMMGILMILAGKFSIQKNRGRFIRVSAIVNLLNFPHGTTVSILVLHGLSQKRITNAIN